MGGFTRFQVGLTAKALTRTRLSTESDDEEGRTVVVRDQPANATAYLTPQVDEIKHLVAQTLGLP